MNFKYRYRLKGVTQGTWTWPEENLHESRISTTTDAWYQGAHMHKENTRVAVIMTQHIMCSWPALAANATATATV